MARRSGVQAALVFLVAIVVYNANLRYIASFDSLASSLLPFRILSGHGLTLEEPRGIPREIAYSIVRSRTGSWVSFYPAVTPLLVTPLYVPAAVWVARGGNPEIARVLMEKLAASIVAAGSAAVLFLVLLRLTRPRFAALLTAAYAFGTSTFTISSQALWLHGTGELLLAACLLFLVSDAGSPGGLAGFGLVAGLLAANRPTDVLFFLPIAFLVVRRHGRRAWPFFAVSLAVGALALGWNLLHFGNVFGGWGTYTGPDGKLVGRNRPGLAALPGLAGLLFSNRGLFFFSPIALLVALLPWRGPDRLSGTRLLLLGYFASLYVHGQSFDWAGSYCYGPRYAIHGLPVLFASLAGPLETAWSRLSGRLFVGVSLALAFFFQIIGAFFYPRGDSGNWGYGLWTLRRSPPALALAAGPAPPDFLGLLVPRLATRAPLPARDTAVRYAWEVEPPVRWAPGEKRRLAMRVTNGGNDSWKGLGGFMNAGGVRLLVRWRRGGLDGPILFEETRWAFLRLKAGDTARLEFEPEAPPEEGPASLVVELTQMRVGPFSERGRPALEWRATLARPGDGLSWSFEGPSAVASGGAARFSITIRGTVPEPATLSWRWRRPGGPVVTRGGGVPLAREWDGAHRADVTVDARVVSGDYLLEFGLDAPARSGGGFKAAAIPRSIAVR
jgi:hypothetical protein